MNEIDKCTDIKQDTKLTLSQAKLCRDDIIWDKMSRTTVWAELIEWLTQYKTKTCKTYLSHMREIEDLGLVTTTVNLCTFSMKNHDYIVDQIKIIDDGVSESTKQGRAAAYISFTKYLSRKYEGRIVRANTNTSETNKTFFKVRDKCATESLSREQWTDLLYELKRPDSKGKIKIREWLIAVLMLQGGKRLNEVLTATIENVDWSKCEIRYVQSKAKRTERYTVITYPKRIMEELNAYLGDRISGLIFVTKNGNKVDSKNVYIAFVEAGRKIAVPFVVHPHVFRASAITYLRQQGYSSDDIKKISGHASVDSVNMYDKSTMADNATKEVSLV